MGTTLTGLTPATTYDALIKVGDNGPITGALKVLSDGLGTNLPMEASTTGINFTGTAQVGGVGIANTTQVAAKQDLLVSGTNIKTVNSTSLLGSGNVAVQDVLVSGTNIKTINSTSLLGSGNIAVVTSPSGVAGAIQFSNGSAFASDATNLFWDDTNNRLGIGTNAPTSPLQVAGTITTQNLLTSGVIYGGSFWLQENGILALGQQSAGPSKFFVKGSGSTSATTSLLVQNSSGVSSLQVKDDGSVFNYGKGAVTGNTAFGDSALIGNTTGNFNAAHGAFALQSNTTGTENSAVGAYTLYQNTTGSKNTAIGQNALSNNTTGESNTAIGYNARTGNFSGSIVIGSAAVANGNNQFVVGSSTVQAGAIDSSAFTQDKRWKVKINGVDYYIALQTA